MISSGVVAALDLRWRATIDRAFGIPDYPTLRARLAARAPTIARSTP